MTVTSKNKLHNSKQRADNANNGRTYIPHGRSPEKVYIPHVKFLQPEHQECGPDWKSSLRCTPDKNGKKTVKESEFFPPMIALRHFPSKNNVKSSKEYPFYPPHGIPLVFGKGKVTIFDGIHKASEQTRNEITDIMQFGKKFEVADPRGNYPEASPGDKPYQAPEYSPGFHKEGSTRPVVNFGGKIAEKADTFIPLQQIPFYSVKPYSVKEKERLQYEEEETVKDLDNWRPASPLRPLELK